MRNNITLERRKFNHQVLALLMGGVSVSSIGCSEEKKTKGSAPVLLTSAVNAGDKKAEAAKRELEALQNKLIPEIRGIIKETETQMKGASERCLLNLAPFFAKAKAKVPEFADWALGAWSKIYYLVDTITFGKTKWNADLLKEKFESLVISEGSINVEITRFRKEYMDEMEEALNKMWIKIETTLRSYPTVLEIQKADIKDVKDRINAMVFSGQKSAQIATAIAGPLFLLSYALEEALKKVFIALASQIATKAGASTATRGAASAAVLSTGAAGSVATFGLSLAGAVAIDYMLGCLLDYTFDPKGNLTNEINKNIDAIHTTIVDGNSNQSGLKQLMNMTIVENLNEVAKSLQGMIQGNAV